MDDLRAGLVAEVVGYRRRIRTLRVVPPVLYLGRPGGVQRRFADDPERDRALWVDLVEVSLLDDGMPADAVAWTTRTGPASAGDRDLEWCAAAVAGFARAGMRLSAFFVLTRAGWFDLLGAGTLVRVSRRAR